MLGLGLSATALQPPIIPIDVLGAGTAAGQGTYAFSINDVGAITGWYVDANWVWHGFVRAPNGFITTFEAPGAGTGIDSYEGTVAFMIGPTGAITGFYEDASEVNHGFLRTSDGTFTTFDAPGAGTAGTGPYAGDEGTFGGSINRFGEIFGWYIDAGDVSHAYLRAPNGMITEFNVRGAVNAAGQGTEVAYNTGLNAAGTTIGGYLDSDTVWQSYVRAANGFVTEFSVSGAGTGPDQGTQTSGINSAGAITGFYADANGVAHGYLRAANGAMTTFNYPEAGTSSGQGTWGTTINDTGWIVGDYADTNGVIHGLLRAPDGALTPFDAPGAGTGSGQGTIPIFINSAGAITGYYADSTGVYHGFLRLPTP
jgi:hypothetical protein